MSSRKFIRCIPESGIAHNENYECVRYKDTGIIFSYSRRGNALCCHFAISKDARQIHKAIDDFIGWAFDSFEWCRMLFAFVVKSSVEKIISRHEFKYMADIEGHKLYVRPIWAE